MKAFIITMLLLAELSGGFAQSTKILIVSTNVDSVGNHQSGSYLMEIAYPFHYFTSQGFEVDIITPRGGKAAIYDNGKVADDLARIRASEGFVQKTNHTLSPDAVKPADYIAVFYPGGHGQYFDVMADERIARLVATIYEKGGVLGTAGHGVASLADIQLSNCEYLVSGKRITCFPHWAELRFMNISNFGKLLPFDMEAVLARRGASLVVCTPETRPNREYTHLVDQPHRLVTGAFATSATWVAEEMVKLIKK